MPAKLHYNIQGEGQAVIILHGLFGSMRNWRSIAKQLAETYKVISVDLRNHGQSEHTDSMTYYDMAGDIYELINTLELDDVAIIGHSMGGKVAMVTALQYEHIIKKLIVIDIAPVSYAHAYEKLFLAMGNLPLNKIKNRDEAEQLLDAGINDRWLTQFLLQNLKRDGKGFKWQLNLLAIRLNIDHISKFPEIDDNAQFDLPTLFLGGAESDFIREEYYETVYGYFPQAQIRMIEKAGHMLHIEQPSIVLKSIKAFLS